MGGDAEVVFIGHYSVGLAAKRVAPAISLGTLFFACQLADLLWPTLLLLGLETVDIRPGDTVVTPLAFSSYPYSHSLLGLLLWGLLLALAWRMRHATTRGAIVLVAVVVSHWVLDGLTHRPDMPISFTGANRVGLGLWNSLPWTVAVEALMFVAALGDVHAHNAPAGPHRLRRFLGPDCHARPRLHRQPRGSGSVVDALHRLGRAGALGACRVVLLGRSSPDAGRMTAVDPTSCRA